MRPLPPIGAHRNEVVVLHEVERHVVEPSLPVGVASYDPKLRPAMERNEPWLRTTLRLLPRRSVIAGASKV